jgi:hypothetical protein
MTEINWNTPKRIQMNDIPQDVKHYRKYDRKKLCKKNQLKEHEYEIYLVNRYTALFEIRCKHCGKKPWYDFYPIGTKEESRWTDKLL